jgi:hypothetical protein
VWAVTPEEAIAAFAALPNYNEEARIALSTTLALTDLYAAADQAAKAVIDSQINNAIAQARALENAPADILELATKIALWRSER